MTIRHLRATAAAWAAHDVIVPDGELALLKEDGRVRIKVGDGVRRFSELPFIDGTVRESTETDLTLAIGDDVRLGACTALSITLPSVPEEDFYAMVTFDSPYEGATQLTLSQKVTLTGDDTVEGKLRAAAGRHYSLLIWNDGRLQGLVRGVALV